MMNFKGKRVVIIGAARQGLALARFFLAQGAYVTLSDRQNAMNLETEIASFEGTGIQWVLGEHPFSLLDGADLLCVSGGIPLTLPIILEAHKHSIEITNDSEIFMQLCAAPVVGITGSAGKTTTTTLVGRMATIEAGTSRTAWVGGNIGNPLIEIVHQIKQVDMVVLELSSFQLDLISTSPQIAAVLNITPNHLDRHGSMKEYTRAKANILCNQKENDVAILNRDDEGSWSLSSQVHSCLISFSRNKPDDSGRSVFLDGNWIVFQNGKTKTNLVHIDDIQLRGEHNFMNVIAACAIGCAMQLSPRSMQAGVAGFSGVKHRLETVREWRGVLWVNDSIATTPERTLAALNAFTEPVTLLLGGHDKNLPWQDLANTIHSRVSHVLIFGEAREKIASAIGAPRAGDCLLDVNVHTSLDQALNQTLELVQPGYVVLLSPGCTSYDAFKDFEERGEFFRNWVNSLS